MNSNNFVHASAEIDDKAVLGNNISIWNWSKVREGSSIGDFTKIGQCCYIDKNVMIGRKCKIQNSVSIYQGVKVEDEVFIGPSVTFTNDLYPRAFNEEWKIMETHIGKGASIGANSTIICGVKLGNYCMIGAGALVCNDVPDYALVTGNPGRIVGYVNMMGKPKK